VRVEDFKLIQNIIEQDSTDTSYKYALLKAVVEICQENDHLRTEMEDQVKFPLGLIVEKWLYYYFPIFASSTFIPQKNGETEELTKGNRLSFRVAFLEVINYYIHHHERSNAYTAFVDDLKAGTVPLAIASDLEEVIKQIRHTIKSMPMKHLGYSMYQQHYAVFQFQTKRYHSPEQSIDRKFLINQLDSFTFSKNLYELFHYIGSFIAGENSVLTTWAEFTSNADRTNKVSIADAIEVLTAQPTESRDVKLAREFYIELIGQGELSCVWTGRSITSVTQLDVDHVLPFSAWKNNDLWNLLPSLSTVNSSKSNKIPTTEVLNQAKPRILQIWSRLSQRFDELFETQLILGLTGQNNKNELFEIAFKQLQEKCEYLIDIRGYESYIV